MTDSPTSSSVGATAPFAPGIDWSATLLLLGIVALLLMAAGAAIVLLLVQPKRSQPPTPVPQPKPPTPAPAPPRPQPGPRPHPTPQPPVRPDPSAAQDRDLVEHLSKQRNALITGCVTASGMLDDDITANVLENALRQGGVTVFAATGQRLDPNRHHVDHTIPAPDPNSDDLVADTITPGYLDNDRILRPAEVVVYRWAPR